MTKPVSLNLDDHAAAFMAGQVDAGRFASPSDVINAGLRLLEDHESKVKALREALDVGEASGYVESFDFDDFLAGRHVAHEQKMKARKA
ncbi:type II toxin-antitoxin system ParD family antitoxin [Asticcacaulis sp. EMRT-3]|uniref:type II toxin-antitoxin system ParD family antitoxin n=1 Tax=Asticcacaulis sp. EMRT-3 TaxID=3040349 RepID=UPI0024AF3405|nr:type II toxin-antitoxin system ParD family antitoxin [Asticcacaulis sp. EMRT-3]MDI7776031.1 type II toxin-antitoxin system ParD family antitoxin [Asticcacaulis sp. EMRT-3]